MGSTKRAGALAGLILALVMANGNSASATTVTSVGPGWILIPGSVGPSTGAWALPACTENVACEPTGDFIFSQPIVVPPPKPGVYVTMLDGGAISDILTFANTGPAGVGELKFYSDPNVNPDLSAFNYFGDVCLNESVVCGTGNSGSPGVADFDVPFADGSLVHVFAASDSEAAGYDPFGFGLASSDQIRFNGVTPTIPEPATLALFGAGLVGLGAMRRRKVRKSA